VGEDKISETRVERLFAPKMWMILSATAGSKVFSSGVGCSTSSSM
jgi:hypothetical protein